MRARLLAASLVAVTGVGVATVVPATAAATESQRIEVDVESPPSGPIRLTATQTVIDVTADEGFTYGLVLVDNVPVGLGVALSLQGDGSWSAAVPLNLTGSAGRTLDVAVSAAGGDVANLVRLKIVVDAAPGQPGPERPPSEDFDPMTHDYSTAGVPANRAQALRSVPGSPRLKTTGERLDGVTTPANPDNQVYVQASNAGVTNSSLNTRVRSLGGVNSQAVVANSTISSNNTCVGGLNALVSNSYLTSNMDGISLEGGTRGPRSIIEYNRIERDGSRYGDRHHDGIQIWQGGNVTIRGNWISGWSTSAIMLKSDHEEQPGDGPVSDVLIEDNYLANPGGIYILYIRNGGKGKPEYVTVRNNVFGDGSPVSYAGSTAEAKATYFVRTEAERDAGVRDGVPGAAAWIVWSGNTSEATGAEVVPPRGWTTYSNGQLIPG